MNLTEASDVTTVLKAAYITGTHEALDAARPAAIRLAERIDAQLAASGRPRVSAHQIGQLRLHGPLTATGTGPLLDPDCRDGKCGSCVGPPCEHECHQAVSDG